MSLEQEIFKKGSTTYYFSARFFPPEVREDVFRLYSFVRVVDDLVDISPPHIDTFTDIITAWQTGIELPDNKQTHHSQKTKSVHSNILKNIRTVAEKYGFDREWVDSFLGSMQMDVDHYRYGGLEDSLEYVYGSAEVIGLMMGKIMGLQDEAMQFARLQGRAMQWVNFIRDIDEDNKLGRLYFPGSDLKEFGLPDLLYETARQNPENFASFMRFQISRYTEWQEQANEGFGYIPRRLRVPLQTAVDMYNWTAKQIELDPMIVFTRKVKPRKRRVIVKGLYNGRIIIPGF